MTGEPYLNFLHTGKKLFFNENFHLEAGDRILGIIEIFCLLVCFSQCGIDSDAPIGKVVFKWTFSLSDDYTLHGPVFVQEPSHVMFPLDSEEKKVKLSCEVKGNPKPHIRFVHLSMCFQPGRAAYICDHSLCEVEGGHSG